jgi:hypothetical protein
MTSPRAAPGTEPPGLAPLVLGRRQRPGHPGGGGRGPHPLSGGGPAGRGLARILPILVPMALAAAGAALALALEKPWARSAVLLPFALAASRRSSRAPPRLCCDLAWAPWPSRRWSPCWSGTSTSGREVAAYFGERPGERPRTTERHGGPDRASAARSSAAGDRRPRPGTAETTPRSAGRRPRIHSADAPSRVFLTRPARPPPASGAAPPSRRDHAERGHQRLSPMTAPVEEDGVHPDERAVADLAALERGAVAHRHIIADHGGPLALTWTTTLSWMLVRRPTRIPWWGWSPAARRRTRCSIPPPPPRRR